MTPSEFEAQFWRYRRRYRKRAGSMKPQITHTAIKIETICKNGSERYGAKAKCMAGIKGQKQMEVSMYGETRTIAMQKLMRFLADGGNNELLLISNSGEDNIKEEEA